MKGRKHHNTGGKTFEQDLAGDHEKFSMSKKADFKPKKLAMVHGKRAIKRLDKPVRGKLDANATK